MKLSTRAKDALLARVEAGKKVKPINNATLYAGSPMYYYCRICLLLAARLPESHMEAAPTRCDACKQMMKESGVTHDEVMSFLESAEATKATTKATTTAST
jgi:NAD-dependent SIR2 family protein deacetylase